jgi:hypothetical protein
MGYVMELRWLNWFWHVVCEVFSGEPLKAAVERFPF